MRLNGEFPVRWGNASTQRLRSSPNETANGPRLEAVRPDNKVNFLKLASVTEEDQYCQRVAIHQAHSQLFKFGGSSNGVGGKGGEGWGPKGGDPHPEEVWVRSGGPPKDGGPKGGGKISRFFFPNPPQNSFFSSSWGVFSWNFGGVFEGQGPEMCTFGVLWL